MRQRLNRRYASVLRAVFYMENMQNPVNDRCEKNSCNAQESYTAVERVKGRKYFRPSGCHFCHGTHTCQYHRRHIKTVQPGQLSEIAISECSHYNGHEDQEESENAVPPHPDEESGERNDLLPAMFQVQLSDSFKVCKQTPLFCFNVHLNHVDVLPGQLPHRMNVSSLFHKPQLLIQPDGPRVRSKHIQKDFFNVSVFPRPG